MVLKVLLSLIYIYNKIGSMSNNVGDNLKRVCKNSVN